MSMPKGKAPVAGVIAAEALEVGGGRIPSVVIYGYLLSIQI